MDKKFIIILFIIVAVVVSYRPNSVTHYRDYKEMLSSQEYQNGELPSVEMGARDISVFSSSSLTIDDNRVVLQYSYSSNNFDNRLEEARCREKQFGTIEAPKKLPEFWACDSDEYKFYRCSVEGRFVYYAVNEKEKNVCYWAN